MNNISFINNYMISVKELGNIDSNSKVVMIHGEWFNNESMLQYAEGFLDKHVILLSLPNRDGFIGCTDEITVEMYADAIFNKLTDVLPIRDKNINISLHGCSLGGLVSLMLAKKYKNVFSNVVCLFTGIDYTKSTSCNTSNNIFNLMSVTHNMYKYRSRNFKIKKFIDLFKFVKSIKADYTACDVDTKILTKTDLYDELSTVDIPVYVIHGEEDNLVDCETIRNMCSELPNVFISQIKDVGHFGIIEDGYSVSNIVNDLFRWGEVELSA